ncbi:MAG TPA: SMI1/KNR4 family protein [Humisphaera sp.]|jgi:hypothetical protein|nr:SMI1/KNR4 family protein [Humisphaera sp.]
MALLAPKIGSTAIAQRLLRIGKKLRDAQDQAKRGTLKARVPCGTDHHYRVNPVLDEAAISDFEARHNVRLPEDYRAFLTHVGDGGAGPYCGVLPLEQWNHAVGDCAARVPRPMRGFLSSLSPLHNGPAPLQSEWASELPPYEWHPFQGAITLNHQGSTFYTLLIVAGESRGRVVYVDNAGQPPYFVRNTDYLSWYERWLDETLAGRNMFWFGME